MREDGLRLDRLLLTTDTTYLPSDLGPAESSRQLGQPSGELATLARTIDYTYDDHYRLTAATYTSGETYSYTYDPAGNRLEQIIGGDTTSYTYDAANRLASVNGLSYNFDANGNLLTTGTLTNTYDAANRLATVNGTSYTFDANGNLLTTGTLTNTWDAANRLITAAGSRQPVAVSYDGLGNRVAQTVGVTTTYYALDVAIGLPEVLYTSEGNTYLHLPSVIMTENATGEVRYLLSDGLGSIRHAVDETASVITYKDFDPYGNPLPTAYSLLPTPYGFTGEWWEDEAGLLYLRARWYLPETGAFLSRDAVESEPPYQYVRGNPVNLTDPSGMCPTGTCGPDITRWLMAEMTKHAAYGTKVFGEQFQMLQLSAISFYRPLTFAATETPFQEMVAELDIGLLPTNIRTLTAIRSLEFALYGLAIDYSNVDYGTAPGCGTGSCAYSEIILKHTPITLCGKCIDSSDIGNMMFGLGGAVRNFDLAFTYGSAATFNFLTGEPILSPDGRGAIPGYLIGISGSYLNEQAFCGILNGTSFIGYNEEPEQHQACQACTSPGTGPKTADPSSLYYVSGLPGRGKYPTITELKDKTIGKISAWLP